MVLKNSSMAIGLLKYASQPAARIFSSSSFIAKAVTAGLDRARFVQDLDGQDTQRRLEQDEALAARLDTYRAEQTKAVGESPT